MIMTYVLVAVLKVIVKTDNSFRKKVTIYSVSISGNKI